MQVLTLPLDDTEHRESADDMVGFPKNHHPRRPRGCESISSQGGRAPGDIVL